MKRLLLVACAALMMGTGFAGAADAKASAAETVKNQALCPVMGGEIDKTIYADVNGKRVYFCCMGCVSKFKEDSAKYIIKLEKEGITLDQAPVTAAKPPVKE